ncbi:MAG: Verru_Chthon cassette protein D [Verrucomicrobium sp.]|nr:Verru_Chthon cassette protein D [Verrucomicrobium sp.]
MPSLTPFTRRSASSCRGFTLVEMLVVVALVFMLLTLVSMGTSSMVQASRLSEAVVQLESTLRLASQKAAIENCEIEVRFYEMAMGPGEPAGYGALQVMRYEIETDPAAPGYTSPGTPGFTPTPVAVTEIQRLPSGVVMHTASNFSNLITDPTRQPNPATVDLDGAPRQVRRVRFLPRGGSDLTPGVVWTLTLCDSLFGSSPTLPPNHVVLALDPETARLSVFRPH